MNKNKWKKKKSKGEKKHENLHASFGSLDRRF